MRQHARLRSSGHLFGLNLQQDFSPERDRRNSVGADPGCIATLPTANLKLPPLIIRLLVSTNISDFCDIPARVEMEKA
ncbi:hypothetical protein [Rhizobium sp. MHM7A]|uniref:hypothetical protein n=1 Tax=Rhizobium sp. MHM7A TaxID=2583233 RepID=UPI001486A7D9|nr:hypothetical protein [Rhizobium sp. MHM7A]